MYPWYHRLKLKTVVPPQGHLLLGHVSAPNLLDMVEAVATLDRNLKNGCDKSVFAAATGSAKPRTKLLAVIALIQ